MTSTDSNDSVAPQRTPHPLHTGENQYSRSRRSSRSSRSSRRSSSRSGRSSRRTKSETSPATKSPIFRQALLTAVFLFGLFLVFGFVKKHLLMSEENKVVAKLKQQELKGSWDIVFVPSRHVYSTCKDWSNYHSDRKQLTLQDTIRHYKENCVNQGHY